MSTGQVVHVLGDRLYDRYVGHRNSRHRLKADPLFANTFKIGEDGTREEVLAMYEDYIRSYIAESPDGPLVETLRNLRGKTLACWCAPKDRALTVDDELVCHAQILLRLADELASEVAQ